MLIVAIAFAAVFLLRDTQILAMHDRRLLPLRLGIYALFLVMGMAIFPAAAGAVPRWTERRFALAAIAVQLAELAIALLLEHYRWLEPHSWMGPILPSPAFFAAMYALNSAGNTETVNITLGAWVLIVAGLASALSFMKDPWEDRKFATDFAMLTSCTALIFVPFALL